MKKTISFLILVLLIQVLAVAQPRDPQILGAWYGEYTGYDLQTQSNITVTRRLIIEEGNNVYSDTLWGQPTELDSIIFEMEIGNWEINLTADSVIFVPAISKRIDISNPDSLVEYDHGVHRKEINEDKNEWEFHDDNMNVDYYMYKEEFINMPEIPAGDTAPVIYEENTYTTSGATSNIDHDLEYSFNWDDGTSSDWSSDTSATHFWTTTGIKKVTVTARCELHPDRTGTSDTLYVDVQDETISKPGTPEGETSPVIAEEYNYTTSGSTSDAGHTIEYSFNWGDGTSSEWNTSNSASHSWSDAGLKYVTVTARCQTHLNKVSTSDNLEVNVETATGIIQNNKTSDTYSFKLIQYYPATLNSPVIISYFVPEHTGIIISVYNIHGQLVKSLVNRTQGSGYYEIIWDCTDEDGNTVNSGVYLFTFKTKDYYNIQKSTFIR